MFIAVGTQKNMANLVTTRKLAVQNNDRMCNKWSKVKYFEMKNRGDLNQEQKNGEQVKTNNMTTLDFDINKIK